MNISALITHLQQLREESSRCVLSVFEWLETTLGHEMVAALFLLIITDNGSEFLNVEGIEASSTGARRTKLYYCDPKASYQKDAIEKNNT